MFLGIGEAPLGPHQIASVLEQEGVKMCTGSKGHKVRDDRRVYGSTIRQILKNPMYGGIWVHNGQQAHYDRLLVPPEDGIGEAATVIPEEWYHQAIARLTTDPKLGRKVVTSKRLLSGLAVSGRSMHPNSPGLPGS